MFSKSTPDLKALVPEWNLLRQGETPVEEEDGMDPDRVLALMDRMMEKQAIREKVRKRDG